MWYVTSQKFGGSALGLKRVLGLGSYQTAWAWLHKMRRAMVRPDRDRLNGRVEVDETYVGGKEKGADLLAYVTAEKAGSHLFARFPVNHLLLLDGSIGQALGGIEAVRGLQCSGGAGIHPGIGCMNRIGLP